MFREALNLREKWGSDTIEDWPVPEVLERYFPGGVSGFDKEGSPILILPFTNIDFPGVFSSTSKENFVKITIRTCERAVKLAREQAKILGPEAAKVLVIIDMAEVGFREFRNFIAKPAFETILTIVRITETVYPDILKSCYIINASNVIYIGFSLLKKFIDSYTLNNIHMFKNDPTKWKPVLLEKIDEHQLPALFGGTQTDPDGNPACKLKIKYACKIPESYYLSNKSSNKNLTYEVVTVKKGDKISLPFHVSEKCSCLSWSFFTESHDIEFSIARQGDEPGDLIVELAPKRLSGRPTEEEGIFQCQEIGTYIVTFDNSFSYFNKKKLHYSLSLVQPLVDSSNVQQ